MTEKAAEKQIHATCIAIDGLAVLLVGPSASGKSDLALRLIDAGARLVADDRVDLRLVTDNMGADDLIAAAPAPLHGMIEVRGLGIVAMPALEAAPVRLVCELVAEAEIDRLPPARSLELLSTPVAAVSIAPFQASAVIKVQLALGIIRGSIMRVDDAE